MPRASALRLRAEVKPSTPSVFRMVANSGRQGMQRIAILTEAAAKATAFHNGIFVQADWIAGMTSLPFLHCFAHGSLVGGFSG